jgi:hypothetical protein
MASTSQVALAQHGKDAAWAGSFVCCGPCGRKRLVAAEFSKKQLEKRAREPETPVKCKQCVEAVAAEERKQAAARQAERITATPAAGSSAPAVDISDKGADALQVCTSCGRSLARDSFNRSQLVKGAGKQARCTAPCGDGRDGARAEWTARVLHVRVAAMPRVRREGRAKQRFGLCGQTGCRHRGCAQGTAGGRGDRLSGSDARCFVEARSAGGRAGHGPQARRPGEGRPRPRRWMARALRVWSRPVRQAMAQLRRLLRARPRRVETGPQAVR